MSIGDLVTDLESRMQTSGEVNQIIMIESVTTITSIYNFLLGLVIVTVGVIMPLVIILEILYIAYPVVRESTNNMLIKIEKRGRKLNVLGFALRDGIKAVELSNTRMIGEKSAMAIYLGLKIKSIMLAAIITVTVTTLGRNIITFVYNLVQSFVQNF